MSIILSIAASLATSVHQSPTTPVDFAVDLFLVGGNSSQMNSLDWLDKPEENWQVDGALRSETEILKAHRQSFVLVDGGDTSIFPKSLPRKVDAMVKTDFGAGFAEHVLLEDPGVHGWSSTHFGFAAPGSLTTKNISFEDLSSSLNQSAEDMARSQVMPSQLVVFSPESVDDSIQKLDGKPTFRGVCFCAWGFARLDKPNFVTYPPAGVVAHYKFYRRDDRLGLTFLGYVGHPEENFLGGLTR